MRPVYFSAQLIVTVPRNSISASGSLWKCPVEGYKLSTGFVTLSCGEDMLTRLLIAYAKRQHSHSSCYLGGMSHNCYIVLGDRFNFDKFGTAAPPWRNLHPQYLKVCQRWKVLTILIFTISGNCKLLRPNQFPIPNTPSFFFWPFRPKAPI